MAFECAKSASRGSRPYQEDSAELWAPAQGVTAPRPDDDIGLLAVLADGMGGHAGGARASKLVCQGFIDSFVQERGPVRDRLHRGMFAANAAIDRTTRGEPHLEGMGSTLVGAAFSSLGLHWLSVGDSPLYLWRRGEIALVNQDHSLAPLLDELARDGKISQEKARNDPRRHMLRSAITGQEIEIVDLCPRPLSLEPGDVVVLASDGIHTIDEQLIARVIKSWEQDGAAAIADALVRTVDSMHDPHQDNTTVIAVRVPEGP